MSECIFIVNICIVHLKLNIIWIFKKLSNNTLHKTNHQQQNTAKYCKLELRRYRDYRDYKEYKIMFHKFQFYKTYWFSNFPWCMSINTLTFAQKILGLFER